MAVTFDVDGFYNAIKDRLLEVMDELMNGFYQEAITGLTAEGKDATEINKTVVSDTSDFEGYTSLAKAEEHLIARCKFYAEAIMQSFGTGSKADTRSIESYWDEYKQGSLYNQSRSGLPIEGRGRGNYTDIYGDKKYSGGSYEHQIIEGMTFPTTGKIVAKRPTYSIQNAENWLIRNSDTRIERRLKSEVDYFIKTEMGKYIIAESD